MVCKGEVGEEGERAQEVAVEAAMELEVGEVGG